MITREELLQFISHKTQRGGSVSFKGLVREFGLLSHEAVLAYLDRLLSEDLIRITGSRTSVATCNLQRGGSYVLRRLEFVATDRGRERLQWYRLNRSTSGTGSLSQTLLLFWRLLTFGL